MEGLRPSSYYYFRIVGVFLDSFGNVYEDHYWLDYRNQDFELTVTTLDPFVLSAPRDVQVTSVSAFEATIVWRSLSLAEGAGLPILYYELRMVTSLERWLVPVTKSEAFLSTTLMSLIPGRQYHLRLRGVNEGGIFSSERPPSVEVTFETCSSDQVATVSEGCFDCFSAGCNGNYTCLDSYRVMSLRAVL
jgi:hypothetical protein